MKLVTAIVVCVCLHAAHAVAAEAMPEHWLAVQRLIGNGSGNASGDAGEGTVQRRSTFVMNGRFIHEINVSTDPPQQKNKNGEVHEHWGVSSFDKTRKTLVPRQFHHSKRSPP